MEKKNTRPYNKMFRKEKKIQCKFVRFIGLYVYAHVYFSP